MTAHAFVLYLALLVPLQPDQEFPSSVSPDDLRFLPFVALLEYTPDDVNLAELRAKIEQERDDELDAARKTEEAWKKELAATRKSLSSLNKQSSEDTQEGARRRSSLHIEIAALERGIREKTLAQEREIPAKYESQLTKIWLAEHWPDHQTEIHKEIRKGKARNRQHGDIKDVGYRSLAQDPEKDIPIGQQAARQIAAGGGLPPEVQDKDVQLYVTDVARNMAVSSDLKVPLHVTVLDSGELRAIALPGGYIYVTSGVLRAAQTESVLAGVLSREIARTAAQHAIRQSRTSLFSRFFVPAARVITGIFTGGASPAAYYGIGYGVEGLSGVMNQARNGNSKKFEAEADQLGIQYMWKAGYDPRGFVAFLDSISATEANDFLNEKLPLRERLLRLFSEIEYLPEQESVVQESGRFEEIKRRLRF